MHAHCEPDRSRRALALGLSIAGVAIALHLALYGLWLFGEAQIGRDFARDLLRTLDILHGASIADQRLPIGRLDLDLGPLYYLLMLIPASVTTQPAHFMLLVVALSGLALGVLAWLFRDISSPLRGGVALIWLICSNYWTATHRLPYHPSLLPLCTAVFLFATHRVLQEGRHGAWAALMTAAAVIAAQLHITAAIMLALSVGVLVARRRGLGPRALGGALVTGLVLLAPLVWSFLAWLGRPGHGVLPGQSQDSVSVVGLLAAALSPGLGAKEPDIIAVALGWGLLLVVVGFVARALWVRDEDPFRRVLLLQVIGTALGLSLALPGASGLPYRYLHALVIPLVVLGASAPLPAWFPRPYRIALGAGVLLVLTILAVERQPRPEPCGIRHQMAVAAAAGQLLGAPPSRARMGGSLCLAWETGVDLLYDAPSPSHPEAHDVLVTRADLPRLSDDRMVSQALVTTGTVVTHLARFSRRVKPVGGAERATDGSLSKTFEMSAAMPSILVQVAHGSATPCPLTIDGAPVKHAPRTLRSRAFNSQTGGAITVDRYRLDASGSGRMLFRAGPCPGLSDIEVF